MVPPRGQVQFPTADTGNGLGAIQARLALIQLRLGMLTGRDVNSETGDTTIAHPSFTY